jgi:general L-amino acid transport system permease protein
VTDQRNAGKDPAAPVSGGGNTVGWLRQNLFDGALNSLITLLCIGLIVAAVVPLVRWGLIDAHWSGSATLCRESGGACWSFIGEKYRYILFGLYPAESHWRPSLAMLLFVAMVAVSSLPRFWNRRLVYGWGVAIVVCYLLMAGGILGLTPVPNSRWGGLPLTLILSVVGIGLAFPLSILLALGRQSRLPVIKALCVAYIELIRGVPLISVLFMASVMFPLLMPEGVSIDKLLRAQVAITLFVAAYLAEVIRGGLQALPRGQYEAADSLGLGYWTTMGLIILPQALKITIPPMVGTFIGTFKDTSLVIIISLFDLMTTTKTSLSDPEWLGFSIEAYLFTAAIYFVFSYFMSRYSQYLEHALNPERKR